MARRFAQPLGIHLDDWESRIIETEKGVVRLLLRFTERGKQLFGESGVTRRWPTRWRRPPTFLHSSVCSLKTRRG